MIVDFEQSQEFDVGIQQETNSVEFQQTQSEVSFDGTHSIDVEFTQNTFNVEFGTTIAEGDYSGTYEVTPSNQAQILPTANKKLSQNIIINPIPNNYGLITWNGATLTVS